MLPITTDGTLVKVLATVGEAAVRRLLPSKAEESSGGVVTESSGAGTGSLGP